MFRQTVEFGIRVPLHIREEECVSAPERRTILLYASDLHLTRRRGAKICGQLMVAFERTNPDVLLLGGDIIDHRGGVAPLEDFLRAVAGHSSCAVGAVPGNHDRYAGRSYLKDAVLRCGAAWLPDSPLRLERGGSRTLVVHGNMAGVPLDSADYNVLCAHYPSDFSRAASREFDLTLAGHYHGSQVVLFERNHRLFPGAFFFPWHGTRFRRGKSQLLVSRGVTDTLPFRWNCPREVLLCLV